MRIFKKILNDTAREQFKDYYNENHLNEDFSNDIINILTGIKQDWGKDKMKENLKVFNSDINELINSLAKLEKKFVNPNNVNIPINFIKNLAEINNDKALFMLLNIKDL